MLFQSHLAGFGGGGNYVAHAIDFDGTNDYMQRGATLTGSTDNQFGLLSVWVRLDGGDNTTQRIVWIGDGNARCALSRDNNNLFRMDIYNLARTTQFSFTTVGTYTSGASWIHVLAAWDTNAGAGSKIGRLYINGISDVTVTNDAAAAFNVGYTTTDCFIGANGAGNELFNGCMSEAYCAPGQFLDITDAGKRLLFRTSSGKPANLASTGTAPTGTAPLLYLRNPAALLNTNNGTGGNFTVFGTLDPASTSPTD